MSNQKPPQLEFMDCLGCGKRVATTAPFCRRCNTPTPQPASKKGVSYDSTEDNVEDDVVEDVVEDWSHAAAEYGGYDDVDHDDTPEPEKQVNKIWWWMTWILIGIFVLGAIFPTLF